MALGSSWTGPDHVTPILVSLWPESNPQTVRQSQKVTPKSSAPPQQPPSPPPCLGAACCAKALDPRELLTTTSSFHMHHSYPSDPSGMLITPGDRSPSCHRGELLLWHQTGTFLHKNGRTTPPCLAGLAQGDTRRSPKSQPQSAHLDCIQSLVS